MMRIDPKSAHQLVLTLRWLLCLLSNRYPYLSKPVLGLQLIQI